AKVYPPAVEPDAAADAVPPGTAEQAHGKFGAAGAHQACDPDHLAAPDCEIDALDDPAIPVQRMMHRPVLHRKDRFADRGGALRKAMGKVAIDHAADDAVLFHRLGAAIDAVDGTSVAQHGDPVGD